MIKVVADAQDHVASIHPTSDVVLDVQVGNEVRENYESVAQVANEHFVHQLISIFFSVRVGFYVSNVN